MWMLKKIKNQQIKRVKNAPPRWVILDKTASKRKHRQCLLIIKKSFESPAARAENKKHNLFKKMRPP